MNINVYYGGRGLLDDPTLFVIERIIQVLEELRVKVTRYNMYEDKAGIATLPNTLKECDGVILAANVEWFGMGGYMQQFLDMCWLYGDKGKYPSFTCCLWLWLRLTVSRMLSCHSESHGMFWEVYLYMDLHYMLTVMRT